jgi:hypothetical protein
MSESPPRGYPAILLTNDYASAERDVEFGPTAGIRSRRLRLHTTTPHGNAGYAVGATTFRDVVVQARLCLSAGDDSDLYGLFVRQSAQDAYWCCSISPAGQCVIAVYDGQYHEALNGMLAPDVPFNRGLEQPNLFQVVACGPSLTFLVNHAIVGTIPVAPRYEEGFLGFYLHHGESSARAELAADWLQVRALFPDE